MTDIFKSADWAREAARKQCACLTCAEPGAPYDPSKAACDPDKAVEIEAKRLRNMGAYLAGLPENPLGPVYMDDHGDLWTITMRGNERVRIT